ncbi:retrotransposon protein, putative, ty1-copia subclass [Tanacetum coccineum]
MMLITEIACLMLRSMTPELHRQFELHYPYDMIQELRSMFKKQAGVEKFDLIQSFHACKQEEGKSVSDYLLKMKGYVEQLEQEDNQVGSARSRPRNGIYEIDVHDLVPNVNSIYNVSNKRVKHNLDSTYLWHCRLAHINKKRIKLLQQDGLLKSTNDESFDKCESCLSGKMAKKPFPHSNERAKDLLEIIHTDVCGPLRHVSRQGASYFITFTDDYSRYGYVYLLKHKHEVFETFKVFKNEVENQLGKTIKEIRSDRGGEYISQEFKDYLKANGIVQQLTPPYTPQHNGVSERRNRTLLDMVRSMMNLTTLPLSFWDYALESATRILNMVPTKKVDKTPYELWYGKVPNLSYLKVAEFFEKSLISQEISGRAVDLEEIQEEEDTTPSVITSNIPQEVEDLNHHKRNLGDLNEPTSYKAAMLDSKSNKWIDAMNAEIQSMMDNMCFAMKDLGEATFILGIKIYRDRSKRLIRLCQNAYMDKILKRYKKDNSKRGHIPMQERLDLNKTQGAQTPKEVNRMKTLELNAIAMPGFETDRDDTKSRQDMFSFLMEAQWIGRLQAK